MTTYLEGAEDKSFIDLADNQDFQKDLVRFFSGSRYKMSREEINKAGPQGLAERFVEHMRWQNTNEYTALQDLSYVRDRDMTSERELQAFGGLITAFDKVDSSGDGFMNGAIDYISAFAASPSTIATVGTAGWGVGTKIAARAAGRSAQAAVRSQIADLVHRQVATQTIKDSVAGTVARGALRGGITSAGVEGAIGAVQAGAVGEIREETTGVGYGAGDLLRDAAISATIGGTLGSAARALDVRTQRRVVEEFAGREATAQQSRATARSAANTRVAAATAEVAKTATDRAVEVANILTARESGRRLDPLDPELVKQGDLLRREILGGSNTDRNLTTSLSVDTLRGVTAATMDIIDELGVGPNERITSAVARGIREGTISPERLNTIRSDYNLSREEMSYIYLSDLSAMGRGLAEAATIGRATNRAGREAAKAQFEAAKSEIGELAASRLSTFGDKQATQIVAETYKTDGVLRQFYRGLQETDSLRIAFMTSQVGTTMANTVTSGGNLFLDVSNQFWKSFANATYGREVAGQVQRNWTGGTLSTIRGMSLDKAEARIVRNLFEESYPLEYKNLFFETGRAESAIEGNSGVARVGRFVNTLNSATDSVFKQASFYSGLDRRLREANNPQFGVNISEFLALGRPLDDLPQEIVGGAMDDARRFTFQRSYFGDESAFGKVASSLESAHQKLPFVVSAGLGIPFPRYIANHLEHINDYTPIGIATGGLNKLDGIFFGDKFKTDQDRFARQMTGMSLILLGYNTAASNEGEIPYDAILTDTGELDTSRVAGPWLANFFLGDLLYRYRNDMPFPADLPREIGEIAGGMGDLGLDASFLSAVVASIKDEEFTPELQTFMGDIAATFTYPLTLARDVQGALDPTSAPTPFTRDVFMGPTDEPSSAGETNYLDVMTMRASRMLPDWDFIQYTQTLNGRKDIPTHTIFNETPVGAFNPLSRQFGFASTPRPNEIQRELSTLNLKEFDIYSRRKIPNPAIAWVVEERLSRSLNDRFQVWSNEVPQGGLSAGRAYNEIDNLDQRRIMFQQFVSSEVQREVEETEHLYNQLVRERPRAASGYIRNMYVLEEAKLSKKFGGDVYDQAVSQFSDFDTAEQFLKSAETIEEEVIYRQEIMTWANLLTASTEQLGD